MSTKLIKGIMMNCTKCHHVNAYDQTITDKIMDMTKAAVTNTNKDDSVN